jgi:putative membrane protein
MMDWGMINGNWHGGGLFMIILWVLVIVGVIYFVQWSIEQGKGGGEKESALEILKKRYAKGEINKQEYEEKKKDLV